MFQDFRTLPDDCVLTTDICVVGAGPAGLSLASEFLNSRFKVVLLESGGFELDETTQALCEGTNIGIASLRHREGRARAFGGTTKVWAGQCTRLDEIDFEQRSWVPLSGWPFAQSELDPYYSRAEAFFNISGEVYDAGNYQMFKVPPPFPQSNKLTTRFTIFVPTLDLGREVTRSIKGSNNVMVLLHANVTAIETNESVTSISSVRIQTLNGKRGRVIANSIVLCGGGIENARLLLLPTKANAKGIGNDRDLVGRFFQEHPNAVTAELPGSVAKPILQEQFRLFYRNRKRYFPRFSLSPKVQRQERVLNCNGHLVFDYPENAVVASLQNIYGGIRRGKIPEGIVRKCVHLAPHMGGVARSLARRYVQGKSPAGAVDRVRLQCWIEQSPNPSSRVLLSDEKDCLDLPRATVDWRLTNLELRTAQIMTKVVCDEFRSLNLGEWVAADWLQDHCTWQTRVSDGAHHMGTTRLATTAENGVVDPNCKVFGIDNLYIAGSSVFPNSGWANPTLTIVALAIRVADHLKRLLHPHA